MIVQERVKVLLDYALNVHASDIHVSPHEQGGTIKLRIGNQLIVYQQLTKEQYKKLIAYFKFSASMDIGEKRKPQNGSLAYQFKRDKIHLRLSTLPTTKDESLVIRIHQSEKHYPLSQLSLFPSTTKKLLSLLQHSHGLIIFSGPTGSGKTTTMYTLLNVARKEYERNIVTLEDPVECSQEGVLQIQINEKAGITYQTGLKAILRHDPDIIMVGEIRDESTARLAIRAALTGHLVLTTLHSRNAKGAIHRLLDLGVGVSELENSLIGVAAQRLVDVKCPYCRHKCTPLCKRLRGASRVGVYELINYHHLQEVFQEVKEVGKPYQGQTLGKLMNKGYALGYLSYETIMENL